MSAASNTDTSVSTNAETSAKSTTASSEKRRTSRSPSPNRSSTQNVEELMAKINISKDLGNKAFQEKDFHKAIDEYEKAIACYELHGAHTTITNEMKGTIGAVYNNRAFAYFKIEMYGAAIEDSTKAIQLKFDKGYYRRGCSHAALMHWHKAKKDFLKAAKIFKNDKNIEKRLKQAEQADKYQKFCKAIETDEGKPLSETIKLEDFPAPNSAYDGPKFNSVSEINSQWVISLQEYLRKGGKLHIRYVVQIMLRALEIFKSHPNVVHYNLPSQSTNGSDAHVGKDEKTDDATNVPCNVSTVLTGQENGNATRITVCGDVHGQYYDFLNIFKLNGVPSTNNPYLFNGDFVDRGSWSMEIILVMLSWKCILPTHFMMTRGNHESKNMNEMYGFKGEVEHKYETRIYQLFCELFNWLPLAYVLGNKIFVCHGGLFQEDHVKIKDIQQLNRVCQPSEGNINPPKEASIMSDLLWSDPQPLYGRAPSKRGGGIMFGPDITKNFLQENNLQMVIRSHEVEKDGFKIHHNGQLVTIFSAPNYVDSMGNKGAYILLDQNYHPTYYQFDAVEHPDVKPMAYAAGPMSFMNFM